MKPIHERETVEFRMTSVAPGVARPRIATAQIDVDLGALSHKGNVRTNNEDHFLAVRFGRVLQTMLTNVPDGLIPSRSDEVGYGMVIADGMGGQVAGEIASQSAISTLVGLVLDTPDWILRIGENEAEEVMRRLADRFCRVGESLYEKAKFNPSLSDMGTTLTVATTLGTNLIVANVGDSRAYLYHDGKLEQLTRDHTVAQDLADLGVIRQQDTATHRQRHILTRALTGNASHVQADVHRLKLADGDQLLLCTDGLSDMVNDAAIAGLLGQAPSAQAACQTLVDEALKNGGRDNVTVMVARYRFPKLGAHE